MVPGFGRLWAASLLLPVACLIGAGWWTWGNVVNQARSEMRRNVEMVLEQTTQTLETQEAVLAAMNAFVTGMDWSTITGNPTVQAFARRLDAATPSVDAVALIDPQGRLVIDSKVPVPGPMIDVSDRSFVRAWPAGAAATRTYISSVVISRVDGRRQVHTSRPRLGRNGIADGGVVTSAFAPDYFEHFFSDVAQTRQTGFSLLRDDNTLIANFPVRVRTVDEAAPDDSVLRSVLDQARGNPAEVQFVSSGSLLTGLHLLAARHLVPYGLTVAHRLDPLVARDNWLRQMLLPVLGAMAALLLMVVLTARTQAQVLDQQGELAARTEMAETGQALAHERAELEARLRQTERVAALGQLAAGVAHDFNNLLQTILLNADMLTQAEELSEPSRDASGLILKAGERGVLLTRRLLDRARTDDDAGPAMCSVAAALSAVEELLAPTLGLEFRLRVAPRRGLPPAKADSAQFEAVVINLVMNARDAMKQGGDITITAEPADGEGDLADGRYVRITVQDTGHGMDEATLLRAQDSFFTTKPRGQGTGLGLAMARSFARQAGGALRLGSAPGKGTTVTLWLPAAG